MRFVNRSLLFFSSRCDVYSFARVRFVLAGGDVGHSVVVVAVAVVEASSSLSIFCLAHPLYIYIHTHTRTHKRKRENRFTNADLTPRARLESALSSSSSPSV
jgi:hypothetical protein